MFKRLRTSWLAGGGAMLLVVSLSGVAAGFTLLADTLPPDPVVEVDPLVDTTLTFEDIDGDGVDDDCEPAGTVTAAPDLVIGALATVDLDADGVISTSEAAQSGWIGGVNCNHGGYVSFVANGDTPVEATTDVTPAVECVTPVVETVVVEPTLVGANAHGKAVSEVAKDKTAIGGKNSNHGGCVSEAAKDKTALDAAKAAAKAERDAAKAERKAARDAAKAERQASRAAAKSAKHHGKPGG